LRKEKLDAKIFNCDLNFKLIAKPNDHTMKKLWSDYKEDIQAMMFLFFLLKLPFIAVGISLVICYFTSCLTPH